MGNVQDKMSGVAVASLTLGILGISCMGPLGAIPAVICGHVALRRIRSSLGSLRGEGVAIGGLALGYAGLVIQILVLPVILTVAVPSFVKARDAAQRAVCVNQLHVLAEHKREVAFDHNLQDGQEVPESEMRSCLNQGLNGLRCPKGGVYSVNPVGQDPSCSVHGSMSEAEAACQEDARHHDRYP